jgi:small subunit ribosomal protein S4e
MRTHMKRHTVPKIWGLPRKGTTFVIKNNTKGVPILVVLRDYLGLAQNRREVKKAIHKKDLMVSNKLVADEKKPVELFDTITIIPSKKNYRLSLGENGKYTIEEIAEKDAKSKVSKVIGKKSIAGKKTQINLLDGRNYLSDVKCNVNDSVIIDLEKNTISKVLPVKEKAEVLVIGGKHSGARAKITKLIPERKMVEVDTKENKYNVLIEHLIVTA